jgi:hypothetical protein
MTFNGHASSMEGRLPLTFDFGDETIPPSALRNQELADRELDQFELKISATPKSNPSS